MMIYKTIIIITLLSFSFMTRSSFAQDETIAFMEEYLMFEEYDSGIILPAQIDKSVFESATFIDTRNQEQFENETIPSSIHIEWREVLTRMDEIPQTGMVILFCNTGSLSAQASFALRVAGRKNVVVMQEGLQGWKNSAAYKPSAHKP